MHKLATLIALVALTSVASAAMTGGFSENTTGTAAITSYSVNDLVINTTLDWTSCELIVTPGTTGKIYQDAAGGNVPPSNVLIGYVPSLEWDTYAAAGSFSTASVTGSAPTFTTGLVFSADAISASYFTTDTGDIGTLELARVTIDSDYTGGTWSVKLYDSDHPNYEDPALEQSGTIEDGLLIPEPVTMLMLIGGGLGLVMRRRK